MLTKYLKKHRIWYIVLAIGIIWIMANLNSFYSYAKNSFTKLKPDGVMSTAVNTDIAVSWEPVSGAAGYQIYEAVEENVSDEVQEGGNPEGQGEQAHRVGAYSGAGQTKNCQMVLHGKAPGKVYHYYVCAYKENADGTKTFSKASKEVSTTVAVKGTSTVKNFLKTAISPIGSTMYVWGGGWNKADTAAGSDAKRIGLSPAWRVFAKNKKASYNYKNYRYQIHNGLDCSGYVGWCVYNVLNTKKNQKGYVYSASKQAKKFADLGFGSYRSAAEVKDYRAGDVMSSTCKCCGHVWIVVGQCADGSVVLVHSSPAGVQLCGTVTPEGKKNSQAYTLAKKYMKKYYGTWYGKYPEVSRGSSYLSHYGQMRWNTTDKKIILSDPDGYQDMSAEEVLKDLFR